MSPASAGIDNTFVGSDSSCSGGTTITLPSVSLFSSILPSESNTNLPSLSLIKLPSLSVAN